MHTVPVVSCATDVGAAVPVVCGFDFTHRARLAVATAAQLSSLLRAPLYVVHATETPTRRAVRALITRETRHLNDGAGAQVLVERAPVAQLVARVAHTHHAALVVIGGPTAHRGPSLGRRLVHRCEAPVLTVNDDTALSPWLHGRRPLRVLAATTLADAAPLLTLLGWLRTVAPCDVTVFHRSAVAAAPRNDVRTSALAFEHLVRAELDRQFPDLPGPGRLDVLLWPVGERERPGAVGDAAAVVEADLIVIGDQPTRSDEVLRRRGATNLLVVPEPRQTLHA